MLEARASTGMRGNCDSIPKNLILYWEVSLSTAYEKREMYVYTVYIYIYRYTYCPKVCLQFECIERRVETGRCETS